MSLDAILKTIHESGQARVREIEARARDDIAHIMAEAEREAESMQQQARDAACHALTADRARIIHLARLEAMRIIGHAEQTVVEQALDRAKAVLAETRTMPDYPQLLRVLVEEALDALQGSLQQNEQVHLYADPRDRARLESLLGDMRHNIQAHYELETWGGVRVSNDDQRVVVDNTLEARLSFATPTLQRTLPALLQHNTAAPVASSVNAQSSSV